MRRLSSPQELEKYREEILSTRDPNQPLITVCGGTGCHASGCHAVVDAFKKVIQEKGKGRVGLRVTGCHGFCERGPLVVIHPKKVMYQRVKPEDVPAIFQETVLNGKILEPLLYEHPDDAGERLSPRRMCRFTRNRCESSLETTGTLIRPGLKTISPWVATEPCPRRCFR